MNLLLALWMVFVCGAVAVAAFIPADVWSALADRIRNPRPTASDRIFERMYGHERDLLRAATEAERGEQSGEPDEVDDVAWMGMKNPYGPEDEHHD